MIKILIKNRLRGTLSGMLGKGKNQNKASKGRVVLFAILFAYLFAAFIFLASVMAFSLGSVLIPEGAAWLYFAIFMLTTLSVVFFLSIFETKSELFDCKDNDLLLSMPLKEGALALSRIIVVLIYNYITEAFVMIPAIAVYVILSLDPIGAIGAFIVSLFLPLLGTALASGVGYAVAYVSKRVRKSSLTSLLLSIAFLALYFWGYNALIEGMDSFLLDFNVEEMTSNLKLLAFIGNAALLKPLSLLAVIAVCLALSFLAYVLISKNYFKLITNNKGAKKIKYHAKKYETRGALSALTRKELRRFFSSSTYMLNSGIGLVFCVVLSFLALINTDTLEEVAVGLFGTRDAMAPVLIAALVMLSSMNMMSCASLSLEGKCLWIPKTIPVSDSTVLLSKVLPQIIVTTPPTLLASLFMLMASGSSFVYWPFFIITPIFANVFFAFLGLIFNILAPRFDFDNEAQPIKQGLPVFLTMMIQMLISIIAIIVAFVFSLMSLPILAAVLVFALFVLLTVVFGLILFIPCKQKYAKL